MNDNDSVLVQAPITIKSLSRIVLFIVYYFTSCTFHILLLTWNSAL